MKVTTKRACDACRRRKIRCNCNQPCENCNLSGLSCTYNMTPQRKGPKGSQAKVIAELRRKESWNSGNVIDQQLLDLCIDSFFAHLYPTMPILSEEAVREKAREMGRSIDSYCLVVSLCAFVLIQVGTPLRGTEDEENRDSLAIGKGLFEEAVRARKTSDFVENPTVDAVISTFFLFGCCFCLDSHNKAWFYLREATALAELRGMQHECYYVSDDWVQSTQERRLFWLLFVTERAYALQKHRPLTLCSTINIPEFSESDTDSSVTAGFLHLIHIYQPFDGIFVDHWNQPARKCSSGWLMHLQTQLARSPLPLLDSTGSQKPDIKTSQHWLRTRIWQLALSKGLLSTSSTEPSLMFTYPIRVAGDLLRDVSQLPIQLMEVHGVGLVEKLFDVSSVLMDVTSCLQCDMTLPCGYLQQLCTLISGLRGGHDRFLPVLVQRMTETLPQMTMCSMWTPQLEDVSESNDSHSKTSPPNSASRYLG